jgi:ATP-dependent helicase HrpA
MNRTPPDTAAALKRVRALLDGAMDIDRTRVLLRLQAVRDRSGGRPPPAAFLRELAAAEKRLQASVRERKDRADRRPRIVYPPRLPILEKKGPILRALRDHRVVIVAGETGCGKSTQIPKMCLEAGRGLGGKIACTQPRRIAAVTIAHRIAEELGEALGVSVGYKIRFQDRTPRSAYIKVLTDGMLLAETQGDPGLHAYDTLIIDEAHERSLNIDFLLGIARKLLDERSDLAVVISSATLDIEKFSRAFGDAPVVEVGGRIYPVEVEYSAPDPGDDEADPLDAAVQAVDDIINRRPPGDVLVFMPTEQDILETCRRLEGRKYAATAILPLFSRLPASAQRRIYTVSGPKIVVATNVAETSLTIPGIRYVVDTGTARIAQYQPGTRINSLPVSPISRASADQRKGRCGRVREGVCLRLYSEEDYEDRPEFTPPEILRSDLAGVVLRMLDLRLGHPSNFPFIDRPSARVVRDGFETLAELGAVSREGSDFLLTDRGRTMARIPLDPRISRMLLEAAGGDGLREVAVIAAAMSIRDPRERPPGKEEDSARAQAPYRHPASDFLSLLNIWEAFQEGSGGTASQGWKRRFCRDTFLSFTRMREWERLHAEILSVLEEQGLRLGRPHKKEITPALYADIHKAVLSGFLSHIAVRKEKNIFTAARGRDVMVFPGSTLFNASAPWIVAAEMVMTSRLFARTAAKIDPGWLEVLGGDLCRRHYDEPAWNRARGEVTAKERVTLYGLEIVRDRMVSYGRIDPEAARDIFIREALVEGDMDDPPDFLAHNLALRKKVETLEEKFRRRDYLASDDAQAAFYAGRLPPDVRDVRSLSKTVKDRGRDGFLRMAESDLLLRRPEDGDLAAYPDAVTDAGRRFPLIYRFAPGEDDDGVTLALPIHDLDIVAAGKAEGSVPGLFPQKIAALVKGLPKRYRKLLMPAAEAAESIAADMAGRPADASFFKNLAAVAKRRFRADIPEAVWAAVEVPRHLKVRLEIRGPDGGLVAAGRNYEELLKAAEEAGRRPVPSDSPEWRASRARWEKIGATTWTFGDLPETVEVGGGAVGYPGLAPGESGVDFKLFSSRREMEASHVKGVGALYARAFAKDLAFVRKYLALPAEYERTALFFGGKTAVEEGMARNLARLVFEKNIRTEIEYAEYAKSVVRALFDRGHALREAVIRVLDADRNFRKAAADAAASPKTNKVLAGIIERVREGVERIAPKTFAEIHPPERMSRLPDYIAAARIRIERARLGPEKDKAKDSQVRVFDEALRRLEAGADPKLQPEKATAVEEFRWLVEEFRIAVFAPELKPAVPVSAKKLALRLREIEAMR